MSTPTNRVAAGVPTGGQFAASAKAESGISLDASAQQEETKPVHLRHPMQAREDQAFLDAMEAAETEACVRHLNKGDWVREYGSDDWGIVKNVGLHTLRTDTWSDSDTDEGDHVVATVPKEVGDALLAEHGALPTRTVNAYEKRKAVALDVAQRWDATKPSESDVRSSIGHGELREAARNVWLSGVAAGLATEPEYPHTPSRDSIPAMQRLEKAYSDYAEMMRFAHSDSLASKLVVAMRGAVDAADRAYAPDKARRPLSTERRDLIAFTTNDLAELGDGETMEFHGAKGAHVSVTVKRTPDKDVTKGEYVVKDHRTRMQTTLPIGKEPGSDIQRASDAATYVHRYLAADDD